MATLITDNTIHDFELSLQEYDDEFLIKPFVSKQVKFLLQTIQLLIRNLVKLM